MIPFWNGSTFDIGSHSVSVLEYSSNLDGWNDDLTSFHEETAGENHFIDVASRRHALKELRRFVPQDRPAILEIGCSSGFMLKEIQKAKPDAILMGSDIVYQPLQGLAKTLKGVPLLRFDLVHCPLPDNSFDAVIMLNVLEHIEDDRAALAQVKRILKPGGIAIIEVPAGPHLYDVYDKILMHYRRYSLKQLRELVLSQNFKIKKKSHLGFFMYPGFWFVKQRNKRFISKAEALQKQTVEENIRRTKNSKLLHALMQFELGLGEQISYPIGIRCLMTCMK